MDELNKEKCGVLIGSTMGGMKLCACKEQAKLAKELAVFKLVLDLDLDEDKVLKLSPLGNGSNSKATIDTLRRSLIMRNRSYKELMTKCNIMGKREARYNKKLEKAKEKIKKLKAMVQELEIAAKVKENEILRSLKVLKKISSSKNLESNSNYNSDLLLASEFLLEEYGKQILPSHYRTNLFMNINNKFSLSARIENINDRDDSKFTQAFPGHEKYNHKDQYSGRDLHLELHLE